MRFVPFLVIALVTALVSTAAPALPRQQDGKAGDPAPKKIDTDQLVKQMASSTPSVRLEAALALLERHHEPAVMVLIGLLLELNPQERHQVEQALQQLAGDWAPSPPLPGDDELSRKIRREAWAGWWRTMDGPALLTAFRQRTLTKEDWVAAQLLIAQLGDKSLSKREQVETDLVALGSKVTALLLEAAKSSHEEQARHADKCLKLIAQNAAREKLPLSAPQLLAIRKPAGASAALLGYLPFTDDRVMKDEVTKALTSLVRGGGKSDVAVVAALSDSLPVRRIAAAEALAGAGDSKHFPAVRKLLKDPDPAVRLRVALALVSGQDKQSVPALIALLGEAQRGDVWEIEELLHRLAGEKAPAVAWGKDSPDARAKLRDDWQAWWKTHGPAVDLAELTKSSLGSGLTLVAEVFPKAGGKKGAGVVGGKDRIVAVDRNGQVRWQIPDLEYPVDFQLLPGNRVLVAEYYASRVTERDPNGKILWEVTNLPGPPVNVQRLANGNTFIAMYSGSTVMEVDRGGNVVSKITVGRGAGAPGGFAVGPGGAVAFANSNMLAAHKMADGRIVCLLMDEIILWLDATGKETKQFRAPGAYVGPLLGSIGAIDVTPKGHVIVVQNLNSVVEYDPDGKFLWQAKATGNRTQRLANGNTLVSYTSQGVTELDNTGQVVWHYEPPAGMQAIRARR